MDYDIVFKNGFDNPINSGMISLVYLARQNNVNDNDKLIIIKIKRKNIDKKLEEGIDNLVFFINLFNFIPFFKKYKLSENIQNNIDIIKQQTNFAKEISNIKRMRNNCKNLDYIKIPYLYDNINNNSTNIIAMEYIHGKKFNEIDKEDYIEFAKQVIKFGIVTSLIHGFSHGDFHVGNILFIKEDSKNEKPKYKLGIIDFGIMITLGDEFKNRILNICVKFFDSPARESAMDLFSIIIHPKEAKQMLHVDHYANIITMFEKCIDEAFLKSKKNPDQTQLYLLFNELNSYLSANDLKNYGLSISDDFVNLQIALAMGQGVTLHLTKNNFNSIINDSIKEMFHSDLFLDEQ
jgi:predicted unusual protein kinase regulating ubiquinone biosynthesis (AarF/ABC1/UbiB family)